MCNYMYAVTVIYQGRSDEEDPVVYCEKCNLGVHAFCTMALTKFQLGFFIYILIQATGIPYQRKYLKVNGFARNAGDNHAIALYYLDENSGWGQRTSDVYYVR